MCLLSATGPERKRMPERRSALRPQAKNVTRRKRETRGSRMRAAIVLGECQVFRRGTVVVVDLAAQPLPSRFGRIGTPLSALPGGAYAADVLEAAAGVFVAGYSWLGWNAGRSVNS
jgi:hypothetical protein